MTNTSKKIISLATLLCFLMTQSVSANPGAGIDIIRSQETPSFLRVDIPSELATLDGLFEAPTRSDPRLILHIQNAHANYGAQQKIRDLLKYLEKTYAIKTIFVEGASEDLNPDYLKMFPDKERNMKLVEFLAKQGELTGAEMYLLEQDSATRNAQRTTENNNSLGVERSALSAPKAHGIENAELYRENYEALKIVFGQEKIVNRYLNGFETRLDGLASRVFPMNLRKLLLDWKKFEKGQREFLPYVRNLVSEAKRFLDVDMESLFAQVAWPQITRLLVLQNLEKELNIEKGLAERSAVIQFLKGKRVSAKLISSVENFQDQRVAVLQGPMAGKRLEPRDLMEQLVSEAGPRGFKFSDYPHFSLYAGYLILKNELDAKALFAEIKTLFSQLLNHLAKTERQKALLELYRDEELVRKLLNLELTRKDWQETLAKKDVLEPNTLVGRLKDLMAAEGKDGGATRNAQRATKSKKSLSVDRRALSAPKGVKFHSEVMTAQNAAYDFYEAARKREEVFYEKIDSVMRQGSLSKAVLITGGFHTDGITELFREHEISYGVLTPRLSEKSDEHLYRSVMLQNRPSTFELSYLEAVARLQSFAVQGAQLGEKEVLRNLKPILRAIGYAGDFGTIEEAIKVFNQSTYAENAGIQINPKPTAQKAGKIFYQVLPILITTSLRAEVRAPVPFTTDGLAQASNVPIQVDLGTIPQGKLKDLLRELNARQIDDVLVGGGMLRDTLFGKVPNDFDLAVRIPMSAGELTEFENDLTDPDPEHKLTLNEIAKKFKLQQRARRTYRAVLKKLGVSVWDSLTHKAVFEGAHLDHMITTFLVGNRVIKISSTKTFTIDSLLMDRKGRLYQPPDGRAVIDFRKKRLDFQEPAAPNGTHAGMYTVIRGVRFLHQLGLRSASPQVIEELPKAIAKYAADLEVSVWERRWKAIQAVISHLIAAVIDFMYAREHIENGIFEFFYILQDRSHKAPLEWIQKGFDAVPDKKAYADTLARLGVFQSLRDYGLDIDSVLRQNGIPSRRRKPKEGPSLVGEEDLVQSGTKRSCSEVRQGNQEKIITGVRESYDQIASEYARVNKEMAPEILKDIDRFSARLPEEGGVLDAGTANGRGARWFVDHGRSVIGIDISPAMIAEAQKAHGDKVQFEQMDIRHLRFENGQFDGIWADSSFHHLPSTVAGEVLDEFRRVLRPDGVLYITVKQGKGEGFEEDRYPGVKRFFKYYEPEELKNLLEAHGFKVGDSDYGSRLATSGNNWVYVFATATSQSRAEVRNQSTRSKAMVDEGARRSEVRQGNPLAFDLKRFFEIRLNKLLIVLELLNLTTMSVAQQVVSRHIATFTATQTVTAVQSQEKVTENTINELKTKALADPEHAEPIFTRLIKIAGQRKEYTQNIVDFFSGIAVKNDSDSAIVKASLAALKNMTNLDSPFAEKLANKLFSELELGHGINVIYYKSIVSLEMLEQIMKSCPQLTEIIMNKLFISAHNKTLRNHYQVSGTIVYILRELSRTRHEFSEKIIKEMLTILNDPDSTSELSSELAFRISQIIATSPAAKSHAEQALNQIRSSLKRQGLPDKFYRNLTVAFILIGSDYYPSNEMIAEITRCLNEKRPDASFSQGIFEGFNVCISILKSESDKRVVINEMLSALGKTDIQDDVLGTLLGELTHLSAYGDRFLKSADIKDVFSKLLLIMQRDGVSDRSYEKLSNLSVDIMLTRFEEITSQTLNLRDVLKKSKPQKSFTFLQELIERRMEQSIFSSDEIARLVLGFMEGAPAEIKTPGYAILGAILDNCSKEMSDKIVELFKQDHVANLLPKAPPYEKWIQKQGGILRELNVVLFFMNNREFFSLWEGDGFFDRHGFRLIKEDKEKGARTFLAKINNVNVKIIVPPFTEENENYGKQFMAYMNDPDVHIIGYVGHAGMGANLSGIADETGGIITNQDKILFLSCCWSLNYVGPIMFKWPNVQVVGTDTESEVEVGKSVFAETLNQITQLKDWASLQSAIDSKKLDPKRNRVLPNNPQQLAYRDFDGDGIPDSRDFVNNTRAIELRNDPTFEASEEVDPNAIQSQKLNNALNYVRTSFSYDDLLRNYFEHIASRGWISSNSNNSFLIDTSMINGEDAIVVRANVKYAHKSKDVLVLSMMQELNEYISIKNHQRITLDDKLRTLFLVSEYIEYYSTNNPALKDLWVPFLRHYGYSETIPLDLVIKSRPREHPTESQKRERDENLPILRNLLAGTAVTHGVNAVARAEARSEIRMTKLFKSAALILFALTIGLGFNINSIAQEAVSQKRESKVSVLSHDVLIEAARQYEKAQSEYLREGRGLARTSFTWKGKTEDALVPYDRIDSRGQAFVPGDHDTRYTQPFVLSLWARILAKQVEGSLPKTTEDPLAELEKFVNFLSFVQDSYQVPVWMHIHPDPKIDPTRDTVGIEDLDQYIAQLAGTVGTLLKIRSQSPERVDRLIDQMMSIIRANKSVFEELYDPNTGLLSRELNVKTHKRVEGNYKNRRTDEDASALAFVIALYGLPESAWTNAGFVVRNYTDRNGKSYPIIIPYDGGSFQHFFNLISGDVLKYPHMREYYKNAAQMFIDMYIRSGGKAYFGGRSYFPGAALVGDHYVAKAGSNSAKDTADQLQEYILVPGYGLAGVAADPDIVMSHFIETMRSLGIGNQALNGLLFESGVRDTSGKVTVTPQHTAVVSLPGILSLLSLSGEGSGNDFARFYKAEKVHGVGSLERIMDVLYSLEKLGVVRDQLQAQQKWNDRFREATTSQKDMETFTRDYLRARHFKVKNQNWINGFVPWYSGKNANRPFSDFEQEFTQEKLRELENDGNIEKIEARSELRTAERETPEAVTPTEITNVFHEGWQQGLVETRRSESRAQDSRTQTAGKATPSRSETRSEMRGVFPYPQERNFSGLPSITIDLISSAGGFGDVMMAVRLAIRLKDATNVPVRILFESSSDLKKLKSLFTDLPADIDKLEYFERKGIFFINGEKVDASEIIDQSKVTIVSQLMIHRESIDLRGSGINVYLGEYDAYYGEAKIKDKLPTLYVRSSQDQESQPLQPNQMRKDASDGGYHLFLPTGFSSELGFLPDQTDEIATPKQELPGKKDIVEMLSRKGVALPKGIDNDRWTLVYYDLDNSVYKEAYTDTYESPLITAIQEDHVKPEGITIFDLQEKNKNQSDFSRRAFNLYHNVPVKFSHYFYDSKKSNWRFIKGSEYPNIKVIHLGTVDYEIYLSLLRLADLPVLIRGDHSLSQAISMNKLFVYQKSDYKRDLIEALHDLARKLLNPIQASKFNLLEGFSKEPRPSLSSSQAKIFDSLGIPAPDKNEDYYVRRVETKWQHLPNLFYDPVYQDAMHELNQKLVKENDLAPKLVSKIMAAIETYDKENNLEVRSETRSESRGMVPGTKGTGSGIVGQTAARSPEFWTADGYELSLYVSLMQYLRDHPEKMSHDRDRFVKALREADDSKGIGPVLAEIAKEIIGEEPDPMKRFQFEPARLETLMEYQSDSSYQAVVELINNGFDATGDAIGRLGRGIYQAIGLLQDEGDTLEYRTIPSTERRTQYRIVFKRVEGVIRLNFYRAGQEQTAKGTQVIIRKAKEVWDSNELDKRIGRRLGRSRRGLVIKGEHATNVVNDLREFVSGAGQNVEYRLGDLGVRYWVTEDDREIHVKDSGKGLLPVDPVTGISVIMEALPVPYTGTNRTNEELQEDLRKGDWTANGEEVFWKTGKPSELGRVVFLVGGTEVETLEVPGAGLAEETVIDLPTACYQRESRNQILLDEVTIDALKVIIDRLLEAFQRDPANTAPAINAVYIALDIMNRSNRKKALMDVSRYFRIQFRAAAETAEKNGALILPAREGGAIAEQVTAEKKRVFIDERLFEFNPAKIGATLAPTSGKSVWIAVLKKVFLRAAEKLLLNRKDSDFYASKAFPGKGSVLLNHLFSVWTGYGKRPDAEATILAASSSGKSGEESGAQPGESSKLEDVKPLPDLSKYSERVRPLLLWHFLAGNSEDTETAGKADRLKALLHFADSIGIPSKQLETAVIPAQQLGSTALVNNNTYVSVRDESGWTLYRLTEDDAEEVSSLLSGKVGINDPVLIDGTVYVMANDGSGWTLYRLTEDSAEEVSSGLLSGKVYINDPVLIDGTVYVRASDGSWWTLYRLTEDDAEEVSSSLLSGKVGINDPVLIDGTVYVRANDESGWTLYRLTEDDAEEVSSGLLSGKFYINDPVLIDGTVYVRAYDGSGWTLYRLTEDDAEEVSSGLLSGKVGINDPVLIDGTVYVMANDGSGWTLYRLTEDSAEEVSSLLSGKVDMRDPVLVNGTVYVVGANDESGWTFYRLTEDDAEEVSSSLLSGKVGMRDPVLIDGTMYVRAYDGSGWTFYRLTEDDAEEVSSSLLSGKVDMRDPVLVNGTVYVTVQDGPTWGLYRLTKNGAEKIQGFAEGETRPGMEILKVFSANKATYALENNILYAIRGSSAFPTGIAGKKVRVVPGSGATIVLETGVVRVLPLDPLNWISPSSGPMPDPRQFADLTSEEKRRLLLNLGRHDWTQAELDSSAGLMPFMKGRTIRRFSASQQATLQTILINLEPEERNSLGRFFDTLSQVSKEDGRFHKIVDRWLALAGSDRNRALSLAWKLENSSRELSDRTPSEEIPENDFLLHYLRGELELTPLKAGHSRLPQGRSLGVLLDVPLSSLAGVRANTGLLEKGHGLSVKDVARVFAGHQGYPSTAEMIARSGMGPGFEFLRENVQNADKAFFRADPEGEAQIEVNLYPNETQTQLTVAIRDHGDGMDVYDILAYLLAMDRTSAESGDNISQGYYGRGWYKNLANTSQVRVITGKKNTDTFRILEAKRRGGLKGKPQWVISRFEEFRGNFEGSEIQTTLDCGDNPLELELMAARIADKLQLYVGALSALGGNKKRRARISLFGKNIDEEVKEEASVDWALGEKVRIMRRSSGRTGITQGGYFIMDIDQYPELWEKVPPELRSIFNDEGLTLEIPASEHRHSLSIFPDRERDGLTKMDGALLERIQKAVLYAVLQAAARNLYFDRAIDYAYRSEHLTQEPGRDVQFLAEKLNRGEWTELTEAEIEITQDSEKRNALLTRIKVPDGEHKGRVSLEDARQESIRLAKGGEGFDEALRKFPPRFIPLLRDAQKGVHRVFAASEGSEDKWIDLPENDWTPAHHKLSELVSNIMTPLSSERIGRSYRVGFGTSEYPRSAVYGKDWISLLRDLPQIAWMEKFLAGKTTQQEDYEALSKILDLVIHEDTHAWENSNDETHNDEFIERQRATVLEMIRLKIVPEDILRAMVFARSETRGQAEKETRSESRGTVSGTKGTGSGRSEIRGEVRQDRLFVHENHVEAYNQIKSAIKHGVISPGFPLILFDYHSDNGYPINAAQDPNHRDLENGNWINYLKAEGLVGKIFWIYPERGRTVVDSDLTMFAGVSNNFEKIIRENREYFKKGVILSLDLDYFVTSDSGPQVSYVPAEGEIAERIKIIADQLQKTGIGINLVNGALSPIYTGIHRDLQREFKESINQLSPRPETRSENRSRDSRTEVAGTSGLEGEGEGEGEKNLSSKLVDGTIYDKEFIEREREISSKTKTVVFDLDDTIAAYDSNASNYLLRPGIEEVFMRLKAENIRLVLWTSAQRRGVDLFIKQHPRIANYFDRIITRENFPAVNYDNYESMKAVIKHFYPEDHYEKTMDFYRETDGFKPVSLLGYSLIVDDNATFASNISRFPLGEFLCYKIPAWSINPFSHQADSEQENMAQLAETILNLLEGRPVEGQPDFGKSSGLMGSDSRRPEIRSELRVLSEENKTEVTRRFNELELIKALKENGFEEAVAQRDLDILMKTHFAEFAAKGLDIETQDVAVKVAGIVRGILRLNLKNPQEAALRLHLLAIAIGADATVQLVEAFKASNPDAALPLSDQAAMVVDILEGLPSPAKLDAIKAILALNSNQHYCLVIQQEVDVETIKQDITDWADHNKMNLGDRLKVIVSSDEAGFSKTIHDVFSGFRNIVSRKSSGHAEVFVLTGRQRALANLSRIDNIRAAFVETDHETIPASMLDIAGTASAVMFSQDLLRGDTLSEKTNAVIQRNGNRYQFRLSGLQAIFNKIASEIRGLLSLARAA